MQEAKRINAVGRFAVAGALLAALAAGALSFGVSASTDEAGGRRRVVTAQTQEDVTVLAGGGRRGNVPLQ
jgi:hypothetical protein